MPGAAQSCLLCAAEDRFIAVPTFDAIGELVLHDPAVEGKTKGIQNLVLAAINRYEFTQRRHFQGQNWKAKAKNRQQKVRSSYNTNWKMDEMIEENKRRSASLTFHDDGGDAMALWLCGVDRPYRSFRILTAQIVLYQGFTAQITLFPLNL